MHGVRFFYALTMFLFIPLLCHAEPLDENLYAFAAALYDQGDFRGAATEFKRYAFLHPDTVKGKIAEFKAGMSLYHAGDWPLAISTFSRIASGAFPEMASETGRWEGACHMLSACRRQLGDGPGAIQALQNIVSARPDPGAVDRAYYVMGWTFLEMGDAPPFANAIEAFTRMSPEAQPETSDALIQWLNTEGKNGWKSSALGGMLSLIPGAGYAYAGRYQDALVAALLNTGLILASVDAFEDGHAALGAVIGTVAFGFYSGNIYGGMQSVRKRNDARRKKMIETAVKRFKLRPIIRVNPSGKTFMPGFSVDFSI
ncbi:MAG: hypothetical protein CSA22_04575 [Deltaproteobacteria bacterium]|nr:MAG: hypothetical protein CSA22_04575 [Deltaproteobacteria bacterium]